MWYVLGGIVTVIIVFLFWRITSVSRGGRQRDQRIMDMLEPFGERVLAGETVSPDEIISWAQRPESRHILIQCLPNLKYKELLPPDFFTGVSQGEASLAYWMMHPNELEDPPERIEHVESLRKELAGVDSLFHVYRYRMPVGHWAHGGEWLLGLVGPIDDRQEPYSYMPMAFSRADDKEGSLSSGELIDWWVDMLEKKGFTHDS